MSQQDILDLREEIKSLKEEIKDEVTNDLGRGYYKMSQTKLIALIGCTITGCLTVFGGVLYIERNLTTHEIRINQNTIDINKQDNQINRLWTEDAALQLQINKLTENQK